MAIPKNIRDNSIEGDLWCLNIEDDPSTLKSNFAELPNDGIHMHPEDLKNIWLCSNCQTAFAFHSEMLDHMKNSGHKQIKKFDLDTGRILEIRSRT